ncbi:hypothetical protein WYO_5209 [Methylobacterium sp. GXF4]|nr:hypothetical protein WYO_5209 [Methylobacterium sp. GXF4]
MIGNASIRHSATSRPSKSRGLQTDLPVYAMPREEHIEAVPREALLSAPDRGLGHARLTHDRMRAQAISAQQHNAGARHASAAYSGQSRGPRAEGDQRREASSRRRCASRQTRRVQRKTKAESAQPSEFNCCTKLRRSARLEIFAYPNIANSGIRAIDHELDDFTWLKILPLIGFDLSDHRAPVLMKAPVRRPFASRLASPGAPASKDAKRKIPAEPLPIVVGCGMWYQNVAPSHRRSHSKKPSSGVDQNGLVELMDASRMSNVKLGHGREYVGPCCFSKVAEIWPSRLS